MALVVIGGVAAGLSAAARARRVDPGLEITVFEQGDVISYGVCGLPYFVEGRIRRPEQLVRYTPEQFRKERNVNVRTGCRVAAIEHARREVVLANGERARYDRLVIATGARCDTSGVAGAGQPHVFTLHTLRDAERLRAFIAEKRPRRAVVIGAGYIGMEAADALRRNGLRVTVIERSDNVLNRRDAEFTRAVRGQLEAHRVDLLCGVNVGAIEAGSVAGVPCDLVVVAAGFKPNVELAAQAGIEIGRTGAIRADERMGTSLGGVYAAGDCVQTTHRVTGRPAWIPLGSTANKTGRVAGANAAGGRERFPGIVGTSIVSIFGRAFASSGLSTELARAEGFSAVSARIESGVRPGYFPGGRTTVELVADRASRRLLGGSVIGGDEAAGRINVIATALQSGMAVDDFESLDLSYSPPFSPVWDPLLVAARQLRKAL